MVRIIDGTGARLGRLASYVAKESLKGEEFVILNCEKIIITGNREDIKNKFIVSKSKIGSGQKGPKISKNSEKIVKRTIRGMVPNHRCGRGKEALKNIRCYNGVPKKFENEKKISAGKGKTNKFVEVKNIIR